MLRHRRKKILRAIICSFLLICLINITAEQLFIRKIYYFFTSTKPLDCYRKPGQSLQDILEVDPPRSKSIFFLETSCNSYKHGKIVIKTRQACAVESAARLHNNRNVYVLFTSPGIIKDEGFPSDKILNALLRYKNINFLRVNIGDYAKNTPIENLFDHGDIEYSEYAQVHASDILRLLTLWKYGGIYLDLDVVTIKDLTDLSENFAGAESDTTVGSAVLGFSHTGVGHEFVTACLEDLTHSYKYNVWAYNGPGVITRLSEKLCDTKIIPQMLNKDCKGFKVYSPSYFYPIPWQNWSMYFQEEDNEEVLRLSKFSYLIHVWNKMSSSYYISPSSNVAYVMFAKKYCPKVYEACNGYL